MSFDSPSPDAANAVVLHPIGTVETDADSLPRHCSVSEIEGTLSLRPEFVPGLCDIVPGQRIVVLFHFDRSPPFEPGLLVQTPPHVGSGPKGVFSICSPRRPNPIGMSVVEVLAVDGGRIRVRGLDMMDGTPILDIKPYIEGPEG
jgi:tRNA (adenine37-N6)-methyltransferase